MSPAALAGAAGHDGLPRRCGDVPVDFLRPKGPMMVAPQVRGCPRGRGQYDNKTSGCPAGAGMSLRPAAPATLRGGLPRRCGDVPGAGNARSCRFEVAPQVRGCPDHVRGPPHGADGCPAGAGMSRPAPPAPPGLPRRCGDVPCEFSMPYGPDVVAPQVRGCPRLQRHAPVRGGGCPAGAGMSRWRAS